MFYEGKKGNLKVRGEGRADFTVMGELMLSMHVLTSCKLIGRQGTTICHQINRQVGLYTYI